MSTLAVAPSPSFTIHLRAKWIVLKGFAYGGRQPTMVGEVHVAVPDDYDFAALDRAMAPLIEEDLGVPAGLTTPAELMVYRLLQWQAAAQRQQKIPIFGSQYLAPIPVTDQEHGGSFTVAVPYHLPQATVDALNGMRSLLTMQADRSLADKSAKIAEGFAQLMEKLQKHALGGTNTFHLLNAAHILNMPTKLVFPGTYRYGFGARGRLLQSTMTDETPALGVHISHSKSKTSHVLRQHGIPTPMQAMVSSEEQALQMAAKIGYPVVIKPDDQEQGRGVEAGLRDDAAVRAAYLASKKHSDHILIEKHHDGEDYRLTVFRGRVIKILHRRAGGVIGDSAHSIAELLRMEQETPRFQRRLRQTGKVLMDMDDEARGLLAERGLSPESVPALGDFIALRRKSNISQGGVQTLIRAEDAHPDNLDLAIRATAAVHLDLCGVDLIMPDISQSWLATGAVIIEMNSQPQIGIEKAPEAYQVILRELVAGNGRIPVTLLICVRDEDCPTEAQALQIARNSNCNGLTMAGGVWIDGRRVMGAPANGFAAAEIGLASTSVTALMCVMTAAEIIRDGLPCDRFDQGRLLGYEKASAEDQALARKALAMVRGGNAKMGSPASNH